MTWKRLLTVLALVVLAFGVAACGGDDDGGEEGSSEGASVSFVSPEDGGTAGSAVTAEVALESFDLDPAGVGKANAEGRGHLHFAMDGGEFDNPTYSGPNGELAAQLGTDGQYSPSVTPTITYKGLPAGEHTLEVDLVNNDHSETGVSETITFTTE